MATLVTKTIKSTGGDYSTRSAFEAAQNGDLVTADEVRQGQIYTFNDTTAVTIDGGTTDSTRYLEMLIVAGEGHDAGVWDGAKANLTITAGFVHAFQCSDGFYRHTGDQVYRNSSGGTRDVIRCDVAGCRIEDNIVRSTGSGGTATGINMYLDGYVANNFIYDCLTAIICSWGGSSYVYFNTIRNCGTGCETDTAGRTHYFKCNTVDNCTTDFLQTAGTLDSNYNASSDATADDWGGTGNRINQTFTFEGADDLRITSGDAGAREYGTDLSGDANYPISTDIYGTARPQSTTEDIGCFEVAAVGAYTLTADAGSYTLTGTAAGLAVGYKLAAAAGSYAYTGATAGLAVGYKLIAGAGSYAYTGTAATLGIGHKLIADAGAYAYTGQDVTLTYGVAGAYTLTAEAGSYAVTGQDVTLTYTSVVTTKGGAQSEWEDPRKKREEYKPPKISKELQVLIEDLLDERYPERIEIRKKVAKKKSKKKQIEKTIPVRAKGYQFQREVEYVKKLLISAKQKVEEKRTSKLKARLQIEIERVIDEIDNRYEEESLLLLLMVI